MLHSGEFFGDNSIDHSDRFEDWKEDEDQQREEDEDVIQESDRVDGFGNFHISKLVRSINQKLKYNMLSYFLPLGAEKIQDLPMVPR